MTRNRKCNSPPPDPDGEPCAGSDVDTNQCQIQQCPYCISLPRSYGTIRACNESDDMIRCWLSCRDDLVFVEDVPPVYFCGRETNYTWNHQTPDNPTAKLPACSKIQTPQSYTLKQETHYSTLPCNLDDEKQTSIKDQISISTGGLDLPCISDGTCHIRTEFHECEGSSRIKRASGSSAAVILYTSKATSLPLNISSAVKNNETLPENIRNFITKMVNVELSAQKLVFNGSSVFTVTVDGMSYVGDVGSVRTSADVDCPPGTTPVSGLCGECPPGSKEVTNLCVLCGRGTYQEWPGMTNCDQCPTGMTTPGLGSTIVEECMEKGSNVDTTSPSPSAEMDDKTLVIALATTMCSVLPVVGVVAAVVMWKLTRDKAKKTPRSASVCPGQMFAPASEVGVFPAPPPYTTWQGKLPQCWQEKSFPSSPASSVGDAPPASTKMC